jgi:hypothetical protein
MGEVSQKQEPIQGGDTPRQDARLNLNTVVTGAVGLTKAALHVDRAAEPVIRQRRAICAACPKATAGMSKTSRCQACTCFIYPKTSTTGEKCPIGKW